VVSNTARVGADGGIVTVVKRNTVELDRIVEVGTSLSELNTAKMPKFATVLDGALEDFD
jgi:hypothetical protein